MLKVHIYAVQIITIEMSALTKQIDQLIIIIVNNRMIYIHLNSVMQYTTIIGYQSDLIAILSNKVRLDGLKCCIIYALNW